MEIEIELHSTELRIKTFFKIAIVGSSLKSLFSLIGIGYFIYLIECFFLIHIQIRVLLYKCVKICPVFRYASRSEHDFLNGFCICHVRTVKIH